MSVEDNLNYYARRAEQEQQLADRAASTNARAAHQNLAALYRDRLVSGE